MHKLKVIFIFILTLVISPLAFTQAPSNDDCSTPTTITPSPSCATTATTLANATAKAPLTNPDVWYSFVATSTTHSIGVTKTKDLNTTSKIFKPIIELFGSCGTTTVITSQPIDGSTQVAQQDFQERTYINLQIGKTYYYRVYNIGSGSTLFNFDTYVCETINSGIVNDDISNAIDLPVSTICDLKTYSVTGASLDPTTKKINGTSYQYSDVWFKTTVPSSGNLSIILQSLGLQGEYGIALYRGTTYANLVEIGSDLMSSSSTSVSIIKTGLTPNEVLYVRLCVLTGTSPLGAFKICSSTPPSCGNHTPAGDLCSNATHICDLNGYCGNTSAAYAADKPGNLGTVLSSISIDNNSWLSFTANATSAIFTVYVSNCVQVGAANGIQIQVFEATNCNNFIAHSPLWSPGTVDNTVITATNLIPGKEYLIFIDGANGAHCDYTISTNSGIVTIDAGPDQIYCNPATVPLNLVATGTGASSLTWDARSNNVLTSNVATGATPSINPGPSQNTTYIVKATGTCAGAVDSMNVTIQNCLCIKPTISTQPQNQTACSGNTVNYSFTSNGVTFQWKESRDNGATFSAISDGGLYSGTKTNSLTITGVTNAYNGYLYKCIVYDGTGKCSDSTQIKSLTISPLTTTNSTTIPFCKGTSTTLTATNNPLPNYSYVWQVPTGVTNPGNVNSFSTSTAGTYTVNVFAPSNLLCNSDFDDVAINTLSGYSNGFIQSTNITCWKTTATDNKIEIWNNSNSFGVKSYSGTQFAELNATQAATLYQDITVIPGSILTISFAHRGRQGTDKMEIQIGPATGTATSLGTFSDNNTAWGFYTVNYTVPANSPTTLRIKFIPVSSSTNDLSFGNFIDAISIKTTTCSILSNEFILVENPLPTAQIVGGTTVCKDDVSPVLTFTGANGLSPYTFTYSINGGTNQTITSTGSSVDLNIPTSTTGNFDYQLISVKEGSSVACSQNQTGTSTFKIIPNSVGGTLTNSQTICNGNSPANLSLTGNVGNITKWQSSTTPFTTWSDISNTTNSYSPSALTQTTKYRVEVQNGICSPVYSNEITITVDNLAIGGSVTSDQSICETTIPSTLNLTGYTGQITKWQFSISPFSTWSDISNTNTSYSPQLLSQTTKYRAVIGSGVCPTVFSQPATITINSKEQMGVSCGVSSSSSVEFIWSDISNETSYDYTYTITGGGSGSGQVIANTTNVTIPVSSGGQTVQITITPTGASCSQAETQSCISQTCLTPVTDQITDINVCSGGAVTIPAFSSVDSPTSYSWNVNNSSFSIGNSGNTNIPSFTAPITSTKITATFSVNAFKAGCTGPTMKFKLNINPPPIINVTNDGPICVGSRPIQLNENSGNGKNWSWSSSGSGVFSSTSIQNPTINSAVNGEIITVTVTDLNNCTNSSTTTLVINPLPTIQAGIDQTICSGNTIFVSASGGVSYVWDNSVVDGVSFTPLTTKTYTVTGTDVNGCSNTDQVIINVNQTPFINDVSQSICSGTNFTVTPVNNVFGQIVPNGTNYTWTISTPINISGSNNQTTAQNSISETLNNNGNTSETITYTTVAHNGNCTSSFNINILVNPLPNFTPSARSKCINEALYVKSNTTNISSLSWTGPNGFSQTQANDNEILVTNNAQANLHQGTYTVTVTDQNNCVNTKNMSVNITPLPTIFAGQDITICLNENVTLTGSGGVTYSWDNQVVDGVSFQPTTTNTYTVIGTDANGCSNSDKVIITVNSLPTIDAGQDRQICLGQNITLKGSGGATYTWDNSVIDNVSFSPTSTATYTVTGIDANNCQNTNQVIITVNPLPNIDAGQDIEICSGESVTLQGSGGNSYSWDNNITNNTSFTPITTTTYTVTGTDINGCVNTDQIIVTVNPLPNVNAGIDQAICFGDVTKLAGSGAISYSWNNGVTDNTNFSPTVTKNYIVIGTDAKGCKNSDTMTVVVNQLPIISAGQDLAICLGDNVTLTGSGGVSYTWDNSVTDNVAFSPVSTLDYIVTGTDANGCKNKDTVKVTVNLLPDFSPTATSQCEKDPLYVQAHFNNATNVVWSGPNGFANTSATDSKVTAVASASLSDNGVYSVEVTDQNGCKNTKTVTVSINPLPKVNAGIDQSICIGTSTKLVASGAVTYSWDNAISDNVSFSPNSTKNYVVIGTDAKGCKNSDTVKVTVNPIPDFTLSVNTPCEQDNLIFNVDLSNNPSSAGILSSNWNGPNGFSSSTLNPSINQVTIDASGIYTMTLTDNNSCVKTKSISAFINPIDNIQFADITPKCKNDNSFLLPSVNISGGTWSSDDNSSIQNPYTGLFDPTKSIPDQEYKVVVTYSTFEIVPKRKCPATRSKIVYVNPIPDASFGEKDSILCIDDTLKLTINQYNKNVNYTWDFGDGTVKDLDKTNEIIYDGIHNFKKGGYYDITLHAKLGSCSVKKTLVNFVKVIEKPTNLSFTQDKNEIDFYNPEIHFNTTSDAHYFVWDFGDGKTSTQKNPKHVYTDMQPGEYLIQLTAFNMENKCSNSVTHSIFMPEPVIYFIPNTFTPNGDELNNTFQPIFSMGYDPKTYSFYIYNRWGELIFESHDPKIGWDGTYGDNLVQNDTYIWKLEFKEKLKEDKHAKTGHVNVLR